jgi:hypothetical protein
MTRAMTSDDVIYSTHPLNEERERVQNGEG